METRPAAEAILRLHTGKIHLLKFRGVIILGRVSPYELGKVRVETDDYILLIDPAELILLGVARQKKIRK
jgi:hypothetical protein